VNTELNLAKERRELIQRSNKQRKEESEYRAQISRGKKKVNTEFKSAEERRE
jgi:hypothetical protein